MRISLAAMMLSTLIFGCTNKWEKNTVNAEDFSFAKNLCKTQSEKEFPVKNERVQETKFGYPDFSISSESFGRKDKKDENQKPMFLTETKIKDVNEYQRNDFFYRCMNKYGWELKFKLFLL
ncbi:MAG TPA: hypothetical protein ACHBZA_10055 [Arsenophonus apicola]|uniref:hypothetical protein n=1 Tax=Arsenophonus TaxID=637 RepID=UPI0015D6D655|nr:MULTISPECIES: hypothetical protein [Arsenophonus]UBX30687.1 hypothetical protein LDL57_15595 [Arsenophonus apicola]